MNELFPQLMHETNDSRTERKLTGTEWIYRCGGAAAAQPEAENSLRKEKMTNKQFWMKANQIAASRKTQEEKAEEMAALLKTAYDEDLRMVILFIEKDNGQHHAYLNLDEKHPNTIGNRGLQCYTSRRRADEDFISKVRGWEWGYTSTRNVINNLFNKVIIGSLIFNCYSPE